MFMYYINVGYVIYIYIYFEHSGCLFRQQWGFLWECGNQKSALSAQNLECRPDNITQLSTYWARRRESLKRRNPRRGKRHNFQEFLEIFVHLATLGQGLVDRWLMTSSGPKLGLIERGFRLGFQGGWGDEFGGNFSNWVSQSQLTLLIVSHKGKIHSHSLS